MAIQTNGNRSAMSQVLKINRERKEKHKSDNYIVWLNEQAENNPSIERLYEIALVGAYFHLSFTDINRLALYYSNPTDKYMNALNLHTKEDKTHYKQYLQDFKLLGYDKKMKASDVLAFMWSDNNLASRDLSFTLYELGKKFQHPGVRFAMIESIEEQGNVLFTAYANLTKKININSQDYSFFGEKHLLLEQGHLVNQDVNEHDLFDTIALTPDEISDAIYVIHATWDAFEVWQAGIMTTLSNFDKILSQSITV
jgi:hypothetical protein